MFTRMTPRLEDSIKISLKEIEDWILDLTSYINRKVRWIYTTFENSKDWIVEKILWKRGALQRPATHLGMIGVVTLAVVATPLFASTYPGMAQEVTIESTPSSTAINVLSADAKHIPITTTESEKPRDRIITYTVQNGDTLSQIAQKYNISTETIKWANDLSDVDSIAPGDKLKILPVSGVAHTVKSGDTVYSVAKKYDTNPQMVVDFPFNNFASEDFSLETGQILIVPEGHPLAKPAPKKAVQYAITPTQGGGAGTGKFLWPAGGTFTQYFSYWHPAVDIANNTSPGIAAADGGTVIVAGYPDRTGYGNRVIIDHGNGYTTLYAHLSQIYVNPGQKVDRGQIVGKMGTTGRSTGIHLHFEIRKNGSALNPFSMLK